MDWFSAVLATLGGVTSLVAVLLVIYVALNGRAGRINELNDAVLDRAERTITNQAAVNSQLHEENRQLRDELERYVQENRYLRVLLEMGVVWGQNIARRHKDNAPLPPDIEAWLFRWHSGQRFDEDMVEVQLKTLLMRHFTLEELFGLAFDAKLTKDAMRGDTLEAAVQNLIGYAHRRGRLRQLNDLKAVGVATKRLKPFVLLDGKRPAYQLRLNL